MRNKKGIELSINFLVVTIISIVVLIMGIYFLTNIVKQGMDIIDVIDNSERQQIEAGLIDSPVSIPINNADVQRGKNHLFGLGVKNVLGDQANFKVSAVQTGGALQIAPLFSKDSFILENGDSKITEIMISVPKTAPSGSYDFKAEVLYEDSPGNWKLYMAKQFYVNVS